MNPYCMSGVKPILEVLQFAVLSNVESFILCSCQEEFKHYHMSSKRIVPWKYNGKVPFFGFFLPFVPKFLLLIS